MKRKNMVGLGKVVVHSIRAVCNQPTRGCEKSERIDSGHCMTRSRCDDQVAVTRHEDAWYDHEPVAGIDWQRGDYALYVGGVLDFSRLNLNGRCRCDCLQRLQEGCSVWRCMWVIEHGDVSDLRRNLLQQAKPLAAH